MVLVSPPVVLCIAGSDPTGAAGGQGDLKTISALGGYGCAVVTSIIAQNTVRVSGVHHVAADVLEQQIRTLVEDVRPDAVKIGMLGSAENVAVVAALVGELVDCPVVLDPVMAATTGESLIDPDACRAMSTLIPAVDLVTPNVHETALLTGQQPATSVGQLRQQAVRLRDLGAHRVYVRGGQADTGDATDVWLEADDLRELSATRVQTRNTYGIGGALSAAITALRPQRPSWYQAIRDAKLWLTAGLDRSGELRVGRGPGPLHHFHALWPALGHGEPPARQT